MAQKPSRRGKESALSGYRPGVEIAIYLFALLGFLVVVHLWIQQGRGFDRGCLGFTTSEAFEASFDCETVVESGAGTLFGISNAVLGGIFYVLVAALTFIAGLRGTNEVRGLKLARLVLVGVGFLYSAWLVYYQANSLGGYCALCLISAGIVTILFALHLFDLFKQGPRPARGELASMKKPVSIYAGLAVLTIVLAGADLIYFRSLPERAIASNETPAVPAGDAQDQCIYSPEHQPVSDWQDFVTFSDPVRGNPEAPVTVITFFDPNCPHCKTLHPIVERVIESHGDQARFIFKPFPLWQHSVIQVQALYAAAQEGKFFEMMDRQFELQRQQGLSFDLLKEIAVDIGMDAEAMEARIGAGLYNGMINSVRERGIEAGIRGMPTVLINGKFVAGVSRSEPCLGELIEQEAAN